QAIAIGLSKARRAGVKLPPPKPGSTSEVTRRHAKQALESGEDQHAVSRKRSGAILSVLRQEEHRAASRKSLSAQARSAARRRTAGERSAAAKRAVSTKGPAARSGAARKAARTRARRRRKTPLAIDATGPRLGRSTVLERLMNDRKKHRNSARWLKGKRVAILAPDGFEQDELTVPRAALNEAGATTEVIAPKRGTIKGWQSADWGVSVAVDLTVGEANPDD